MSSKQSDYTPTIGIECHVQLKTKTKLFAAVENDAREAEPNTLISHICVGMPGALPVLNKKAVELAILAAFALNTKPQKFSKFDRKHYFYPDLPKGYQITQYDQPIITGGYVDIETERQASRVRITRIHLEEDAGKNIHPEGADYSLVDLNRAGTPLLEIVSEPDIHSAEEARAYVRELWLIMKYAGVTDGDLYHGHVRFDVNISIAKESSQSGIRTEVKNLNSFRSVENAVNYEILRQIELSEKGHEILQETRGWDEAKQKTISQRGKEEAHDYRYFPEPDIPPLMLEEEQIHSVKKTLPVLPASLRNEFRVLKLDKSSIEILIASPQSAEFIKNTLDKHGPTHSRRIVNWMIHSHSILVEGTIGKTALEPIDDLAAIKLSKMVEDKVISSSVAKNIWVEMLQKGGDPLDIANRKGLLQISSESFIESIVNEVLVDNPKAVEDITNGEMKALGFLVGQVMKKSRGKANPSLAHEILKKKLDL